MQEFNILKNEKYNVGNIQKQRINITTKGISNKTLLHFYILTYLHFYMFFKLKPFEEICIYIIIKMQEFNI